ncbi:uncharacterized protein EV420DRAFT_1244476, partial [Desarmillaria tabescens]
ITAWNVHKDEINRLGMERFANETGQDLIDFYSNDSLKNTNVEDSEENLSGFHSNNRLIHLQDISNELQTLLWNQPPSATSQHLPGKLRLCLGLPVMIRYNNATELCITKGQEASVYAWQSTVGNKGQRVLDTLFVKLTNPPTDVHLDGLPLNVVPLTPSTTALEVNLPSRERIIITREQIEVLPNFTMTDYASQGKTRPYNVVDVAKCRSHQALYTCLSRSSTAAGTLILQKWTGDMTMKVQGRASNALRQEFRELELLDKITKLRYDSQLNSRVIGLTRSDLIKSYRKVKGMQYIPHRIHSSIKWDKNNPFIEEDHPDIKWHINPHAYKRLCKDETMTNSSRKRHASHQDSDEHIRKKSRGNDELRPSSLYSPEGLIWSNNSCAYDALLSILYNVWKQD